jgi:hypothetical protein
MENQRLIRARRSQIETTRNEPAETGTASVAAALEPRATSTGPRVSRSILFVRIAIVCAMFVVAYRITVTPFSRSNIRVTCTSDQQLYRVQKPALALDRYAALRQCIGKEGPFTAVFQRDQLPKIAQFGDAIPNPAPAAGRKPVWQTAGAVTDDAADHRFLESLRCTLEAFYFMDPTRTERYAAANVFRVRYIRAANDSATSGDAFLLDAIKETDAGRDKREKQVDSLVYVSHETGALLLDVPRIAMPEASVPAGSRLQLLQSQGGAGSQAELQYKSSEPVSLYLEENMLVSWRGDAWYRFANVSDGAAWVQLEQYVIDPKELPRFGILSDIDIRAG